MWKVLVLLGFLVGVQSYIVDPGPVANSIGEVWPKPRYQSETKGFFLIDPKNFNFVVEGHTCDILEKALLRYKKIIASIENSPIRHELKDNSTRPRFLQEIVVNLTSPCEEKPHLNMDEWYYVASSNRIMAYSIWGMLRGLETFSQLITPYENGILYISEVRIRDAPRFSHRGLLLDTSRHYMSMSTIYSVLDGMEYNKLNVFHWHIVDDQSFPYESVTFPELSEKGAYSARMVYSQEDVAKVIEYARLRGIRVLVEFDVPGHTRSWGESHPELLTECGNIYKGKLGPVNPIKSTSYNFLDLFFKEVAEVFPDDYIHVGGDEVGFECWDSNDEIRDYILTHGITYTELQRMFMENITLSVVEKNKKSIVWQEAMVHNINMPNGTVVQVWTGNWRRLLSTFTSEGLQVLLSACWYLDHLATGGDWLKYYACEPLDFSGTEEQKELVMGGEACMWSEVVSDRNVLQRIFPRVSAVAERLWSPVQTTDIGDAKRRIEEHTCRMVARGIPAQPPNGPGIC